MVAAASRRIRLVGAHVGVALAVVAGACVPIEPEPVQLEVFSWWQEGAEHHALSTVADLHESRHPDVVIEERADTEASVTRRRLAARLLAKGPPATFQANAGADLLRWTVVDYKRDGDDVSDRRIHDVSDVLRRTGLLDNVPKVVLDALRVGDDPELYGIPLNIHRINVLYYNVDRVAEFEREHGRKLDDISTLCPEEGVQAPSLDLKLALGARDTYSLVLLTFENVLPALTNAEFYDSFWRGRSPESPTDGKDWTYDVRRALECVQHLSRSVADEVNPATLGWASAAAMVADDGADFTVMGDWADGTLRDALASKKVASMPFPGTRNIFVFTSDCFPLPVGTPHPKEAEEFLETLASPEAQLLFSQEKGSLPARSDVNVKKLGARAEAALADFEDPLAAQVLALSGLLPYYYPLDELGSALADMVKDGAGPDQVDAALQIVEDAYPLLQAWQARLGRGAATPLP